MGRGIAGQVRRGKDGRVREQSFFEGLVAALASQGVTVIDVRNDRHQVSFARVVGKLRELQDAGDRGSLSMPDDLYPGPITGKYEEFDNALLRFQGYGLDSAQNPLYPAIILTMDEKRGEELLEEFGSEERQTFLQLARVFTASEVAEGAVH